MVKFLAISVLAMGLWWKNGVLADDSDSCCDALVNSIENTLDSTNNGQSQNGQYFSALLKISHAIGDYYKCKSIKNLKKR